MNNILEEVSTILISFSGGRTSGMMTQYLLNNPKFKRYNKEVIFANVGREKEQTLQFVKDCDDYLGFNTTWVEADITQERGIGPKYKVVDLDTATRIGDEGPFDAFIRKLGIPNPAKQGGCTRDLKLVPINKYMRSLGYKNKEYITAIGIRADEPKRLTKRSDAFYPLAEIGITELAVRQWWKTQTFDLQLEDYQGNCDLCWKKSERKMLTCMSENSSEDNAWWVRHEESAEMRPDKTGKLVHPRFSRAKTPAADLLKTARLGDFKAIEDKFANRDVLSEPLSYDPSIFNTRRRGAVQ